MDFLAGNMGWIEVVCGPMFSGKSEELIRRLRRAMIARKRVQVDRLGPRLLAREHDGEDAREELRPRPGDRKSVV